jgi:hypothetical protein
LSLDLRLYITIYNLTIYNWSGHFGLRLQDQNRRFSTKPRLVLLLDHLLYYLGICPAALTIDLRLWPWSYVLLYRSEIGFTTRLFTPRLWQLSYISGNVPTALAVVLRLWQLLYRLGQNIE